jgi:hypothetical protein
VIRARVPDYEERDGAPRRRSRDTTNQRRLDLLAGAASESSVMRRSAAVTSSSVEEPGSTLSAGRGGSAESSEDCCSSRATVSSGSERSPRASVAKRGSTSTSSGLTISGWAGLSMFPGATIRDLYPSNEGRSDDRVERDRQRDHRRRSSPAHPLGDAIETFIRGEDAERFIEEVRGDDPELASRRCRRDLYGHDLGHVDVWPLEEREPRRDLQRSQDLLTHHPSNEREHAGWLRTRPASLAERVE